MVHRLTILKKIRLDVGNNSAEGKVKELTIFCIDCGKRIDADFKQYVYKHHEKANNIQLASIINLFNKVEEQNQIANELNKFEYPAEIVFFFCKILFREIST